MKQVVWEDIQDGDELPAIAFPLTLYRLVMTAGANRDFNPHHHNTEYALSTGAPEIYANTLFLQGMWERVVRDYIGLRGTIRQIRGFRMGSFNCAGDTVTVKGKVLGKRCEDDVGIVELKLWSENRNGVSVGPGIVTATVPMRNE